IVVWKSSTGKELKGIITRAHGNNGAVRAHFKKAGVPGQALGTKVQIIK
ncbi:MAG: 50S ribosomal protein L35ae, partial [Promethearchaeota archaeon]